MKQITTNQLLANSFVITLDKKRLSVFNQIFEQNGLSPLPQPYDGFKFNNTNCNLLKVNNNMTSLRSEAYKVSSFGCSASHASLVKLAKYLDLPFICIFEDDAYPCKDILKHLSYYLQIIPDNCECLSLGNILMKNQMIDASKDFFRIVPNNSVNQLYGAHSYVIFREAYDKYIQIANNIESISDWTFTYLSYTYATVKNLFIQHNYDKRSMTHNGNEYVWKYRHSKGVSNRSKELILKSFPDFNTYNITI